MTLRIAIFVCLAAASVWAQTQSASLTGRVVSAADGSPLAGALVLVRTTSMRKAWTGPDGRFRLAGLADGTYAVLASKSGFHYEQQRRRVDASGDAEELVMRLVPESLIAGTATGPDGAPLEGSRVALWEQLDRLGDTPILMERREVRVDDLGQFRFFGLPAGNYLLALEPAGTPAPEGVERLTAAPMLYPEPSGTTDLATLRLRPGERLENVDFRAAEPSRSALEGQVSGCGSCIAAVYRRTGEFFVPVYTTQTATDGTFYLVGLAPGPYVVAARNRSPGESEMIGLNEVLIAAGLTARTQVFLSEGAQMTVTKTHRDPPEQDTPRQRRGMAPPVVTFEYLGPELARRTLRGDGIMRGSAADAEYTVGLSPGPYTLRVRGIPSGGYLAAVLVDGRPPSNGRFVVADGATQQTEVIVGYDSGTIEGTVTAAGDQTLKDARIYLLPQNPVLPSDLAQTSAGETGAFSIKVGPGNYDVYAMPSDADWDLADVADRQRLAGYRASVGVATGQTATVKVKLAPLSSW